MKQKVPLIVTIYNSLVEIIICLKNLNSLVTQPLGCHCWIEAESDWAPSPGSIRSEGSDLGSGTETYL